MSEIKFLTVEDILNAKDLREKVIEVPEWGGSLTIRELTAGDRDWLQASMLNKLDDDEAVVIETDEGQKIKITGFQTKVVALSVVDAESKRRLFSNEQISDLAQKSGVVLSRIASECTAFNRMEEDDKDLKAAGEDSPATQSAGSESDSPDSSDVPSKSSTDE
jgi:hypothetical protein